MKSITTNLKKQTLTFILVLLLALSSFVGLLSFVSLSKKEVFAESSAYNEVSIANSNFNSGSSSVLTKPSSFSAVGTKNSTVSGVIDVNIDNFNENKDEYKLNFNPSKPKVSEDNKILMINNQNLRSSFGYESSSFTLEKNKYYFVSCYVFTQYDDIASTASLYLSNTTLDNLDESKIENISTRGSWKEYRFYVKTNSESQTVKLTLFIGSKNGYSCAGAVFFDNIKAYNLTEQQYYNELSTSVITNKEIVLTNKDVSSSNGILNGDFETETLDFTKNSNSSSSTVNNVAKVVGIGTGYFNSEDSKVEIDPTNANRANNNKALLVNNYNASNTTFVSNDILIERHKLYKLTIDVKSSSFVNGGAVIKLEQKNPYSSELKFTPASVSFSSVSTSDKTNEATNDWITYSFFITGNAFKNSYANLTIGLEENAIGYVFFDNIKLFEITSEEYSNNSTGSNAKTADFTGFSGTDNITNSSFNNIDFVSTNETSPYQAKDWIVEKDENNNNYNGIIDNYLDNQNVFVMANVDAGYQSLKSANFNMSASTIDTTKYYKIRFELNTNEIIYNGVDVVISSSDGSTLAKLYNINTNNAWNVINFYVKTSTSDIEANIKVIFGTESKQEKGYAYVDNFEILESTKEAFEAATNSNTSYKADLTKIDFNLRSEKSTNNIFSADNFTGTKNSTQPAIVESGIVNINTYPVDASGSNDYVLVIHNIQDAYYTLKSNGFNISSGNYYKVTASVRTLNLKQDEANKQFDDEGNQYKIGAKISLSGISAEINNIEENNDFAEYTFYINATSDTTIYISLSLGDENALTSGYAFFDNLSVNQISEDDFNEAKKAKTEEDTKTVIIGDTTEKEEENNTETESSGINFDWLVLPTLIIGIALLIAMVGLLLRKIKIKIPVKASVKDYDRAKTLVKEHEKREKMKQREERLQSLREKLEQLENEIKQNKNEFKNSKSLKQEIKDEHEKVDAQIKQSFSNVNSQEAQQQARKLKLDARNRIKQLRKERYQAKREELMQKYLEIEKEIEEILREERLLVEEWKAYKKQQKLDKKEKKLKNKKKS